MHVSYSDFFVHAQLLIQRIEQAFMLYHIFELRFLIEMYQNSDTVFISPKAAANICTDSLKNNAHNSVEKHKFLLPLQEKTTGMW